MSVRSIACRACRPGGKRGIGAIATRSLHEGPTVIALQRKGGRTDNIDQRIRAGNARGNFGRIVSESPRGVLGKTQRTVYAASKAAIMGMTRFGVAPMPGGAGRHAITPQNP